jgi:hypothetical protein
MYRHTKESIRPEIFSAVREAMFDTDTNSQPIIQEIENITTKVIDRLECLGLIPALKFKADALPELKGSPKTPLEIELDAAMKKDF